VKQMYMTGQLSGLRERLKDIHKASELLRTRTRHLLHRAPLPLVMLDEAGYIIDSNVGAACLLAIAEGRAGRIPFTRFVSEDDKHRFAQRLDAPGMSAVGDLSLKLCNIANTSVVAVILGHTGSAGRDCSGHCLVALNELPGVASLPHVSHRDAVSAEQSGGGNRNGRHSTATM
jgi:hypothetical protein